MSFVYLVLFVFCFPYLTYTYSQKGVRSLLIGDPLVRERLPYVGCSSQVGFVRLGTGSGRSCGCCFGTEVEGLLVKKSRSLMSASLVFGQMMELIGA